ncbi:hypothetical protein KIW84_061742 [Lathyrus oleraceus]|uniref:Chromo domain-containing protein n=1 Tax=Pisum sativum TaxID=3888 RepID=A0A9D4W5U0_PEA|nr:hypothetical protein KIW84_061742 [Pisum sativum]
MSQQANKRRSERVFAIGLDKIGSAAYKLELPAASGIHNVFHVSQLKLYPNPNTAPAHAIATTDVPSHGQLEPEKILDRKMVKRGRVAATKVLVQWKNSPPDRATWEFYYDLLKEFPNFHPLGQGCSLWGGGHANLLCIVPILSDVPEGTLTDGHFPNTHSTNGGKALSKRKIR